MNHQSYYYPQSPLPSPKKAQISYTLKEFTYHLPQNFPNKHLGESRVSKYLFFEPLPFCLTIDYILFVFIILHSRFQIQTFGQNNESIYFLFLFFYLDLRFYPSQGYYDSNWSLGYDNLVVSSQLNLEQGLCPWEGIPLWTNLRKAS